MNEAMNASNDDLDNGFVPGEGAVADGSVNVNENVNENGSVETDCGAQSATATGVATVRRNRVEDGTAPDALARRKAL